MNPTLLKSACASIQSRVRRELLGERRNSSEVLALQKAVLSDDAVRKVFATQVSDGWLGEGFHGYGGMEAAIRLLCEKDVDPHNPDFSRALGALRKAPVERLSLGLGRPGGLLDATGLGGGLLMRAVLLAQAGLEGDPLVLDQIPGALAAFRMLFERDCPDDFIERYRDKLTFRVGVVWPSIYHLRLLAFTRGWRTPENLAHLGNAIGRLVAWSPLPLIYLRHGSQLIAPASFAMREFKSDMDSLDDGGWMMWFHRLEMLARLGILHLIPGLQAQVDRLEEILERGDGMFTIPLSHEYYRKWGAYTGLMLEQDWRQPERRINDLTFRSLLILHYR